MMPLDQKIRMENEKVFTGHAQEHCPALAMWWCRHRWQTCHLDRHHVGGRCACCRCGHCCSPELGVSFKLPWAIPFGTVCTCLYLLLIFGLSMFGGLMRCWGEAPLYMPADAPHSNFGAWKAYTPLGQGTAVHASRCPPLQFWGLEGLCATGARCHCTCQQTLPTLILGLGGLMHHWGEVLLYMPVDASHSNFGAWRAYAPLGRGTTVYASGRSPLQFWGLEGLFTAG